MFSFYKSFNSQEAQHRREIKYAEHMAKKQGKHKVPNFSFGANELVSGRDAEDDKALEKFVKSWFLEPKQFLDYKKYSEPEVENVKHTFSFESFLNKDDEARFYEDRQPFWRTDTKTAFIILPHWNASFEKYRLGTAMIRDIFLPVATYRYFPYFKTEDVYGGGARFDIVGPNLGMTIKRFWQDVLNIQFFANYLKNKLDYKYVGIWAYSIGSPRGMVASMFSEDFDFLIMNFLADSFPEAVLNGISTKDIALEMLKNIPQEKINELWSPLSPGKYEKYFNKLPRFTRLVQPEYDLVFGEKNNERMIEKILSINEDVDVEFGKFGHLTCKEIDKVIPMVVRNSKFVLKGLEECEK
jgi:hypothetical protein